MRCVLSYDQPVGSYVDVVGQSDVPEPFTRPELSLCPGDPSVWGREKEVEIEGK